MQRTDIQKDFLTVVRWNRKNWIRSSKSEELFPLLVIINHRDSILGVHTIWIRGFDSKTVVDTFGLPDYMIPVMMLGLGYPNEKAQANAWHYKRNPIEDFVFEL